MHQIDRDTYLNGSAEVLVGTPDTVGDMSLQNHSGWGRCGLPSGKAKSPLEGMDEAKPAPEGLSEADPTLSGSDEVDPTPSGSDVTGLSPEGSSKMEAAPSSHGVVPSLSPTPVTESHNATTPPPSLTTPPPPPPTPASPPCSTAGAATATSSAGATTAPSSAAVTSLLVSFLSEIWILPSTARGQRAIASPPTGSLRPPAKRQSTASHLLYLPVRRCEQSASLPPSSRKRFPPPGSSRPRLPPPGSSRCRLPPPNLPKQQPWGSSSDTSKRTMPRALRPLPSVQEHGGETILPFSCAFEQKLVDMPEDEAVMKFEDLKELGSESAVKA
ncbi:uncharacterized protein [Miscanthus floridulus]|uniref:uncharacterized protein n=1 Tax=Miscanthus floridulus TaxID=154761 RepID=UPI003458A5E0